MWIVELGDADRDRSFDAFSAAITAAEVSVSDPGWTASGPHPGFHVVYGSPTEGTIEMRPDVALLVDGEPVDLAHDRRFDNPYTSIARGTTTVPVADELGGWLLDLARGRRGPLHDGG